MKKIILISRKYPPSVGGMQTYSRDLVKYLSKSYDLNLILMGKSQAHLLWFLPYAFLRGIFSVLTGKYQALYVCDGMLAPLGAVIKYLTGIRTLITIHGLDITYKNRFYQAVVPAAVTSFDRVICVSNSTIQECVKKGVDRQRCVFIPNGIDISRYIKSPESPDDMLEGYFGYSCGGKKVLMSVGRLVPRKGISWFIENIFNKLDESFLYIVVGDGPEKVRIADIIQKNGFNDRVKLLGKIDEDSLNMLYDSSYAFIMPNLTLKNDPEGFGIVILEAARAGLPIIAHNVDGINDAVLEGRTGWLVPEGDKVQMISRINTVGLEKGEIKKACSEFDWSNIIEEYKNTIDAEINDHPVKIFSVTMTPIKPPFDDGPKNIVYGIAKRLKGYKFYFISSMRRKFPYSENIRFIRSPFQRRYHHSMTLPQKVFVFMAMLINAGKIDIFQFFFTPNRTFARVCGYLMGVWKKKSVQIISSVHTLLKDNAGRQVKDLFFGDAVIVQTDHGKKILEAEGISNVKRIYPGIDLARYDNVRPVEKYVSYFEPGYKYILYPGNYGLLMDSYSFEGLCGMFQMVLRENKDIRFVMACRIRSKRDILLEKEFKRLAEKDSLGDKIVYFNTVDDMPALMAECSLGVLPVDKEMSRILEIPLVVVEMAAMGKPFIYGKVSPMEELMDKGIGLYPEDNEPESYSEMINVFLSDEEFAVKTGAASKKGVEEYFNIDMTSSEYENVYKQISGIKQENKWKKKYDL